MTSCAAWFLLFFACFASAQDLAAPATAPSADPAPFKLKVKTRMVEVTALVRKKGEIVHELKAEDFVLLEDGKPRTIRYFNVDADLPLTLGLLVDVSGSQEPYMADEREASHRFLERMITRPEDRALVAKFDGKATMLQSLTSDVAALRSGLEHLPAEPDEKRPGGTILWDAAIAVTHQFLGPVPGRRALVILTDGDDNSSHFTVDKAISVAQLHDVPVYSILYTDDPVGYLGNLTSATLRATTGSSRGALAMSQLAQETGGHVYVVSRTKTLDAIYAEIESDMRSRYRFGFTPTPSAPNSRHDLVLKMKKSHYDVQARNAYFMPE